ncbi:hypothetical protein FB45DRAFT_876082 [Roridomyces roridus]|uniref:Uncharacterized protein n=1 Tax=Roridomyces roridus TaxID=1738132 RepID=A0AAD7FBC2_9AGAR|nr:hypothetical protein FB45DRAFT_876082 [Roridomyces roridus]
MDMSYHGFARILYTSSPIGHNTHIRYMNHIVPTSDTAATWSIRVFPADSINGGDEEEEEDDDISATNIILAQRRARKAAREAAQRDDEEQEDSTTPANPSGSSTAGSSGASASAHGRIRRSFFPLCSLGIIIQDRNSFPYPNVIHFPTHSVSLKLALVRPPQSAPNSC